MRSGRAFDVYGLNCLAVRRSSTLHIDSAGRPKPYKLVMASGPEQAALKCWSRSVLLRQQSTRGPAAMTRWARSVRLFADGHPVAHQTEIARAPCNWRSPMPRAVSSTRRHRRTERTPDQPVSRSLDQGTRCGLISPVDAPARCAAGRGQRM
jgi:hypothetical protein